MRVQCARTATRLRLPALILTAVALAVPAFGQSRLKRYETSYYVVHTDLGPEAVREAEARLTAMGEMYHQRTKHFGGRITRKLPFLLFSRPQDYYAAGGIPGSAGLFDGEKMMAIAGAGNSASTWHVVQHEGFHQFVHSVIGGDIPMWVNEGLAEYFGQALFTGDDFVIGVVPPGRLHRLKTAISAGRTLSIEEMMRLSHSSWNASLNVENYDQAWSMVHFLAHAENGRYQQAFNSFLKDVSRGIKYEQAWRKSFGVGTREFDQKWRQYWLEMREDASKILYARAAVATFSGFAARAAAQRQTFESFEAFAAAARSGGLKQGAEDWLPPALLKDAVKLAPALGRWQLVKRSGRHYVICTMDDGTSLRGTFRLRERRVVPGSIEVTIGK